MEATIAKSNDAGISIMKETNGDETAPTSLQLTTGPQTTNVSENVDSGKLILNLFKTWGAQLIM